MSDQQYNRLNVLKKLRATQPITRTNLAAISGLTGGTITAIIGGLVARGLVLEETIPSPRRGRPKVNLRINPDGAYAVGAVMTDTGHLQIEVIDLSGKSIAIHDVKLGATSELAELAQLHADAIAEAIAECQIPKSSISQIGIGLPAIVDGRAGVVEYFATLNGAPFHFADSVASNLGIPTSIDNNFNLLARSEHWFGDGEGVEDFTLVVIDLGLGAARYHAGQLLLGSHNIEAELGHVKITAEGGRQCHCGGEGCLQAYCSISGIVGQCCEFLKAPLPQFWDLRDKFAELAAANDASFSEYCERAGRYLGRTLANHINMEDPQRILVFTTEPLLVELMTGPMFEALRRDTLPVFRDLDKVTFKALTESSYARGAAAMVLERLYDIR